MKILNKFHNKIDFYLDKLFGIYVKLAYRFAIGSNFSVSRKSSI